MQDEITLEAAIEAARELGREAGVAAGSWAADGKSTEDARRVLTMMEDGDPRASDYLPVEPNLSGEWADAPTPGSLYEDVTGRDAHGDATWNQGTYQAALEAICEAWESGVMESFSAECERVLRAAL